MKKYFLSILIQVVFISFGFSQTTLEDKIGQMIMVGVGTSQTAKDSLIKDIQERNLGGILFFATNLESPSQMSALTSELQSYANTPLLLSTDQEGGRVARLGASNGFQSTKTAAQLGQIYQNVDSTRNQAKRMAEWFNQVGLNTNLAPVVDVEVNANSPAIGKLDRSYSSNPDVVTNHASAFAEAFHEKNIITALKHFPGHGSAVSDSHFGFTEITSSWKDYELDPFRDMVANGYSDMIMTGHLYKGNWDSVYPTSISNYAVTKILRDSLKFDGVVISDELFMKAISNNYGFDEAIILCIQSGTDILLFNTNFYNGASLTQHIINLVKQKIESNLLDENLIDAAFNRIQTLKNKRVMTPIEDHLTFKKPSAIQLGNFPNPFNPSTTLQITIAQQEEYSLEIYSTLGQKVAQLHQGALSQGNHFFEFNATHLASGMYLAVLKSQHQSITHKLSLIK